MDDQFFSLTMIIRWTALDYVFWRSQAEFLIETIANEENA